MERTPINYVLLPIDVFGVHDDEIFDAIIIKQGTFSISALCKRLVFVEHQVNIMRDPN
jgi:hypothetical protein